MKQCNSSFASSGSSGIVDFLNTLKVILLPVGYPQRQSYHLQRHLPVDSPLFQGQPACPTTSDHLFRTD